MLLDNVGTEVKTLGVLMFKCTTLENQVAMLRASVHAKDGVVCGDHQFISKEALLHMITKNHPCGTGPATFSNAFSIFTRDKELSIVSNPHRMLNRLGVTSIIGRNYIMSFRKSYPLAYAGTARSIESSGKLAILLQSTSGEG